MGYLLKIVEGPNKGAEIALVEGVAVTLGKGDDCDVILADPTMPSEPSTVTASESGVTLDGSPLVPFQVVTRGATSFAVGPSDAPWGELKWPEKGVEGAEPATRKVDGEGSSRDSGAESAESPEPAAVAESGESPAPDEGEESGKKRRGGCLGCLVSLVILLAVLAILAIFLKDRPQGKKLWGWTKDAVSGAWERRSSPGGNAADTTLTLDEVVANHGLTTTNRDSRTVLVGDFATRTERLVATAEAYAAKPGVELDFCDDETLKTAAEDTIAMLSENDLHVVAATNRVVALSGKARRIRRALEALAAEIPKLRNVDVADVRMLAIEGSKDEVHDLSDRQPGPRPSASKPSANRPAIPVCGILTTPYPCLVLRSGARIHEGASFGDSVVLKIEADAVTVTNATGKFVWKP